METEMFEITGGPSKFDFIVAISFRKQDTQRVKFKVRSKKGVVEEFEVEILAIMQTGNLEDGEGHWWRFMTSCPDVIRNGHWERLRFNMIGLYSTGGKGGRSGSLRSLTFNQRRLLDAAFGHPSAWDDLKKDGFRLPDTKMFA